VHPHCLQAEHVLGLDEAASGTDAEQGSGVRAAVHIDVDPLHLLSQESLGSFLRGGADTHADADAAVALVDEQLSVVAVQLAGCSSL